MREEIIKEALEVYEQTGNYPELKRKLLSLPPQSPSLVSEISDDLYAKLFKMGVIKYSCNADCPDAEYGNCCHPNNCCKKVVVKEGEKDSEDWISVSEKLPEENELVIAFFPSKLGEHKVNNIALIHFINEDEGFDPYAEPLHKEVTHWMPLPNPPKQEQQKTGNK